MKQKISFKLFGGLQIQAEDGNWKTLNESVNGSIGKKQQAFLAYLLLNHKNRISSSELIDHFWPGDSKDPANSLKNMIHKTRALLSALFPDYHDLFLTQSGYYEWNSRFQISLDTDILDQFYHEAKNIQTAQRTQYRMKAFEAYSGNILPGISLEWLDHLNTYYRTLFIDVCKSLAIQLLDEHRWDDVIRVCSRAYTLSPEIEEFTLCYMQALINNGLAAQAISHYENYRSLLWSEFNLIPSDAVERAHTLAVFSTKSADHYEEKIVQQLSSLPEEREAFHCSLLVFQNIIQLELRHMARGKYPSSLVILHIESPGQATPNSTDIRRTEKILLQCLRAGDPFTRLNQGSFSLLLSSASTENAEKVMNRVLRDFHSIYPRSRAILRYHVYPLEIPKET